MKKNKLMPDQKLKSKSRQVVILCSIHLTFTNVLYEKDDYYDKLHAKTACFNTAV